MTEVELTLEEKLERYATLRDTLAGLEAEKDALGAEIKAAMLAGAKPVSSLYRAALHPNRKVTYPLSAFREAFGDAATLEVATINPKRVAELVKAGDLDAQAVEGIAEVEVRQYLYLKPLDDGQS